MAIHITHMALNSKFESRMFNQISALLKRLGAFQRIPLVVEFRHDIQPDCFGLNTQSKGASLGMLCFLMFI